MKLLYNNFKINDKGEDGIKMKKEKYQKAERLETVHTHTHTHTHTDSLEKGITLVALTITVIVLLILAGINKI